MDRRDQDRGAAMVEFALVLPILLLLVFGIIEFGRAYNVQTSLTAAARQAARVMALQNNSAQAKSAAQSVATTLGLTISQISVTACASGGTTTATVTYPMTTVTNFFGPSITLTGKGVMRCNG